MTKKAEVQAEIDKLQAKLNKLNRIGNDNFVLGTVLRFAANQNTVKWHIIKVTEELWVYIGSGLAGSTTNNGTLEDFILEALDSGVGYFEVYELKTQPNPFYTES